MCMCAASIRVQRRCRIVFFADCIERALFSAWVLSCRLTWEVMGRGMGEETSSERIARETAADDLRRRQGRDRIGPDFSDLQVDESFLRLGVGEKLYAIGMGSGPVFGLLAFCAGLLIARGDWWWFAPLLAVGVTLGVQGAVWAVGRVFGVARSALDVVTEAGKPAAQRSRLMAIVRWVLIGSAVGLALGASVPALLGEDIAMTEGIGLLVPTGAMIGLFIGLLRAGTMRKR